jgi:light-regulated signal transduction histidine kinase (bacteriophytochrome)
MPEFKDITKLSPLPILNLQDIGLPVDGLLVPTPETCKRKWAAGKCATHYEHIASDLGNVNTLFQCPYGFATLAIRTTSNFVALTAFIPYPRQGGEHERAVAKKHGENKVTTESASQSAQNLEGAIKHFENLENESVKKHSVALHEIRKLNRTVKQTAERLCNQGDVPDPELVKIWKSSDMMSQQFDVIELLANESLMQLPVTSECDLYPLFDKCVRIYMPSETPGRITLRAIPFSYSGSIMACDKTIMILPTVLIENGLKYSIPGEPINVTIEQTGKWVIARVRNVARRSTPLPRSVFQKGVRQSQDQEGSGNGLYLAQLVAKQHKGTLDLESRMTGSNQCECAFILRLPPR